MGWRPHAELGRCARAASGCGGAVDPGVDAPARSATAQPDGPTPLRQVGELDAQRVHDRAMGVARELTGDPAFVASLPARGTPPLTAEQVERRRWTRAWPGSGCSTPWTTRPTGS